MKNQKFKEGSINSNIENFGSPIDRYNQGTFDHDITLMEANHVPNPTKKHKQHHHLGIWVLNCQVTFKIRPSYLIFW